MPFLPRTLQGRLGDARLAFGLRVDGPCFAHFDAIQHREHLACSDPVTELRADAGDAARNAGREPGETILIRLDRGGYHQLIRKFLLLHGLHPDAGGLDVLVGELDCALFVVVLLFASRTAFLSGLLGGSWFSAVGAAAGG